MRDKHKLIKTAITTIFIAAASQTAVAEKSALANDANTEKCYGIVKAGMNDCATAHASCAGSATKDKQADAFIFLPKGTCDKIAGASLTPPQSSQK